MSCLQCEKCVLTTLPSGGSQSVFKMIKNGFNTEWYSYSSTTSNSVEITDSADLDHLNALSEFLSDCSGYGGAEVSAINGK